MSLFSFIYSSADHKLRCQAMFITVKYGYEEEQMFNTDLPCKMLMARIQKVKNERRLSDVDRL